MKFYLIIVIKPNLKVKVEFIRYRCSIYTKFVKRNFHENDSNNSSSSTLLANPDSEKCECDWVSFAAFSWAVTCSNIVVSSDLLFEDPSMEENTSIIFPKNLNKNRNCDFISRAVWVTCSRSFVVCFRSAVSCLIFFFNSIISISLSSRVSLNLSMWDLFSSCFDCICRRKCFTWFCNPPISPWRSSKFGGSVWKYKKKYKSKSTRKYYNIQNMLLWTNKKLMFTNELFVVASFNLKRTFLFRLKRTKIYNRTVQGKMVSYFIFIVDIYKNAPIHVQTKILKKVKTWKLKLANHL